MRHRCHCSCACCSHTLQQNHFLQCNPDSEYLIYGTTLLQGQVFTRIILFWEFQSIWIWILFPCISHCGFPHRSHLLLSPHCTLEKNYFLQFLPSNSLHTILYDLVHVVLCRCIGSGASFSITTVSRGQTLGRLSSKNCIHLWHGYHGSQRNTTTSAIYIDFEAYAQFSDFCLTKSNVYRSHLFPGELSLLLLLILLRLLLLFVGTRSRRFFFSKKNILLKEEHWGG